jgi:hypothetical protein
MDYESDKMLVMQELQPPIYIFDLRIGEPVTAITDVLITAVCFYAFFKLKGGSDSPVRVYFKYYFALLGIATLWGGVMAHAFQYALGQPWKAPGWILSTWAISLLAFAMVQYHKNLISGISKIITGLIVLELVVVMSVIIYTVDFKWAGAHSAFGLALITGSLSLVSYIKLKDKGSFLVLIGVGYFLISGIIFSVKLSLHTWFNHVDLAHVFITIAAYQIFRGVEEMGRVKV